METTSASNGHAIPRSKGKPLGQKLPLKPKQIGAIRIRLQLDPRTRELALFNLAIDSNLRGSDLPGLRVHDVVQRNHVASRAIVMQRTAQQLVRLRSRSKRATRSPAGSQWRTWQQSSSCSRAVRQRCGTSQPGSIPGRSGPAWGRSGPTHRLVAPVP
jgi:hypothetical protein